MVIVYCSQVLIWIKLYRKSLPECVSIISILSLCSQTCYCAIDFRISSLSFLQHAVTFHPLKRHSCLLTMQLQNSIRYRPEILNRNSQHLSKQWMWTNLYAIYMQYEVKRKNSKKILSFCILVPNCDGIVEGYHSCFVLGKSTFKMTAFSPAILTENYRGFLQSFWKIPR